MSAPGTLSLDPITLPTDADRFSEYLFTAQALLDDFKRSFNPSASSSSDAGWRKSSSSTDRITVKTARGSALGKQVTGRLSADEIWIGRHSEHGEEEGGWSDFKNLLKDETARDSNEWIPELRGLEIVKIYDKTPANVHGAAAVWISRLALPMPLQDRTFLVLVVTLVKDDEFWNVTFPFSDERYPPGAGGEIGRTRGSYVSVEKLSKLPTGKTEWIVLTSFTLGGGIIPQAAVNFKMQGKLVDDVGHFLRWIKESGGGVKDVGRPPMPTKSL